MHRGRAAPRHTGMETLPKEALQKGLFVKGIGIAIGECVFGLNGPLLFHGMGLNDPESAFVGALLGAAAGYGFGWVWVHYLSRLTAQRLFGQHGFHRPPHGAH